MPRYSALTRLRYALLDLWACIRGAVTPLHKPIAPQPMPRPDPRRCVVMGDMEGDPAYGFSDLLWGYYLDADDGGGDGPSFPIPPGPQHGVEKKATPQRLPDARAQRRVQDHVTYRTSAKREKVWIHRK